MLDVKIILALNDVNELGKIKHYLASQGFDAIEECTNGTTAIRRIHTLRPDLIIVDYNLKGMNGMQIAEIVQQNDIAPVIVIKSSIEGDLWLTDDNSSNIVFLHRPITKSALLQTIQLSLISYNRVTKLKEEIRALKETLSERKNIEKAKGILMKKYGLNENDAHKKLQKQSMDKGIPIKELAQAIIIADEIN
jgi:response regulator NasT